MATKYDYHESAPDTTSQFGDAGDDLAFQTFTPDQNYTAGSISLKMYKPGTGSIGNITVSLRLADGNHKPTGDDLTSGTTPGDTLTTDTDGEWRETTITSYELTSGTEYAIVAKADSADENKDVTVKATLANVYTTGYGGYSDDGAGSWNVYAQTDILFRVYGLPVATPPTTSGYATKKLIAIASNELWYESVAGTMSKLADSVGQLDTSDLISISEAYGKIFICNKTNKKVADFVNTKIATADLNAHAPDFHTVLTGTTSGAKMIVDYITSTTADAACTIYGKRTTTATFASGETVTGTDDDGNAITFVLSADEVAPPHWYSWNVYGGDTTFGSMPDQVTLGCNWRGRVVISGDEDYPHQWYMPRQGNPWDWNYVSLDAGSPIAGGNSEQAGEVGDVIVALIPYDKDYFIFGCANSLWYLAGDPAESGSLLQLDSVNGILSPTSWCFSKDGSLYILATTGILQIPKGFGTPVNLTEESYPDFIVDLAYNPSLHRLSMSYDRIRHGINIFKTTLASGANSCWWYDLRTNGLFPESYPSACGVFSTFYYEAINPAYRGLLFGCNDGYIREHLDTAKDDDSGASDTAINSYVTFGPIPLGQENNEGSVNSLVGVTTGGLSGDDLTDSNNLTYKIWAGRSADEVVGKLKANTSPNVAGTITAPGRGRGGYKRKKIRGVYAGVRIGNSTASQTWGLEKLIVNGKEGGRSK